MTRVTDFIWVGDEPVSAEDLSAQDLERALPEMSGQFALDTPDGSGRVLVRDPLGINKLFFAVGPDGAVDSDNFLVSLVERGHALKDIYSVPSGHLVRIDAASKVLELKKYANLNFAEGAGDGEGKSLDLDSHATAIRARLETVFGRLAKVLAGRPLYVTLSGGLDSTTIATLVRQHIGPFTAITFSMAGPGNEGEKAEESEDLRFARLVADRLDVPIETVFATPEDIVALVDEALVWGQDWREFNVHCALVNARIASDLGQRHASTGEARPVVLTGDTMNELVADYSPVSYAGSEFYALPRLTPGRLRRFLVSGLDSGDREVGVFARHGIDVIQPYAMLADAYAALPDAFVADPGAKQHLVEKVMGDAIPREIYERPKVRAQVGGADEVGGTLAALVDAGFTGERLLQRFAELMHSTPEEVGRFIRAGFYRFTNRFPPGDNDR